METNPNVPRQRNRRTDRSAAEAQVQQTMPVQQTASVQQAMPVQQTAQVQQAMAVQPVQQGYPAQTSPAPQPRMQAQPRVMAPPRVAVQQPYGQVNRTAAPYPQQMQHPQPVYPPMQQTYAQPAPMQGYPQQMQPVRQPMMPAQQARPVQQTAQPQPVQYVPRARAAVQPVVQQPVEVPHARASRGLSRETAKAARVAQREAEAQARQDALERAKWQAEKAEWEAEKKRRAKEKKEAAEAEPQPRKKLPGWLTTALSLSLICVMALVAAYYLMQAYLVTQEEERQAAYQAILENYHVTEQADGTLRVTWQDYIEKYAAQYNLQPAFVTAIIRNESSFRTAAESSVGARGLMQLMPDTAEWIAGKLDDTSYSFDRMYDAETNIRYGCWYLGYLSKLFHGDAMLVSAAYHAGQTTVTQWLSDPTKSADGVSLDLDALADGPTKQYIGRVTQTYGIYQSLLYPDEAFGAADAVSAGSRYAAAADR